MRDKTPSVPHWTPVQNTSECVGNFVVRKCQKMDAAPTISTIEQTAYNNTVENLVILDLVKFFTNYLFGA